jgi:hypothetical protein
LKSVVEANPGVTITTPPAASTSPISITPAAPTTTQ